MVILCYTTLFPLSGTPTRREPMSDAHGGGDHGGGDHGGGGHGGGGDAIGAALGALVSFSTGTVGKLIIGAITLAVIGRIFHASLGDIAIAAAEWIPALFGMLLIIMIIVMIVMAAGTGWGVKTVYRETFPAPAKPKPKEEHTTKKGDHHKKDDHHKDAHHDGGHGEYANWDNINVDADGSRPGFTKKSAASAHHATHDASGDGNAHHNADSGHTVSSGDDHSTTGVAEDNDHDGDHGDGDDGDGDGDGDD